MYTGKTVLKWEMPTANQTAWAGTASTPALELRAENGTVRCAEISEAGKTVAAAAAVLGENASLISAVAVLPEFHRRGFGRKVVEKTEQMLPGGTVYILREKDKNEAFYDTLGYAPCGAWAQGKL